MSELAKKPSSTCARFTRLFLLGALASVFNIGCSPKPEAPAFSEQTPSTKPSVITARSTQAQQQTVRVRALYSSTQCPVTKAQFRLMATEEWSQLTRPAHHLGETSSDAPPSSDHEHWILVSLGERPSSGYGLTLLTEEVDIVQNTLELPIGLVEPKPGMLHTTHMTTPCLILGVAYGDYQTVRSALFPNQTLNIFSTTP